MGGARAPIRGITRPLATGGRLGVNPLARPDAVVGTVLVCAVFVALAPPTSLRGADVLGLARMEPRIFIRGETEPGKARDVVLDLAFSPDSKTLASGGAHFGVPSDNDPGVGQVKLWNVQTGKVRAVLADEGMAGVMRVVLSPNGKMVMAGCYDGPFGEMNASVRFWDATSGRLLRRLKWPRAVLVHVGSLAVSGDGRFLAVGSLPYGDGNEYVGLRVWDIRTDKTQPVLEAEKGGCVGSVAFSPDNSLLFAGQHDGVTRIWDTQKWSVVREIKGGGGGHRPLAVCPCPQRHLAAITHGEWTTGVAIWDYSKGQRLRTMAGARVNEGMAFSPDGALLAVGGQILISVPGFPTDYPPDDGVAVDLWDVAKGKLRATLPISGGTPRVSFAASGEYLACCDDSGTICVWDFRPGSRGREEPKKGE